jgi:hypothetical protein
LEGGDDAYGPLFGLGGACLVDAGEGVGGLAGDGAGGLSSDGGLQTGQLAAGSAEDIFFELSVLLPALLSNVVVDDRADTIVAKIVI